jgi:hypothetical protein
MVVATQRMSKDFITSIAWYAVRYPNRRDILMSGQNLLRKSLAWNFNHYQKEGLGPFSNDADILKHHVSK